VILCALPIAGVDPDAEAIRNYLHERLASYKLPRHVLFFEENEISFTGTQKVQIGPLREEVLRRLRAGRIVIEGFEYGDEDEPA
jgi:fatty-acyl-CoA synthase